MMEPSAPIAEQAPEDAAEKHARHLHVDEPSTLRNKLIGRAAEILQAGDADDAEEDEVGVEEDSGKTRRKGNG